MIITFEQITTILSLTFVLIGGVFALVQWRKTNKIKRAEFVDQIIRQLRFDKEMASCLYMVDYERDWYDFDFHGNTEIEFSVDRLLSYLSYICYLYSTNNISEKEFGFLNYEINRVCISEDVQSYLWNLYHFSTKCNAKCSFEYLIDYGLKRGYFCLDFKSKDCTAYPQYLRF